MDETTAPVLDPGRRKTKTGYFWALARDDRSWGGEDPPGVAFTYAPGRSGQYADQILKSFSGTLQVDGYAGYNRLLKEFREKPESQIFAKRSETLRCCTRFSMDGKGRFLDNIFVERLWRSLKYECVYLHAWETGSEAKAGVRKWLEFYNRKRPNSALGGQPPAVVYWLRKEETTPDQQEQRVA